MLTSSSDVTGAHEEAVRALAETSDAVLGVAINPAHEEDRQGRGRGILAEATADFEAVDVGELDVAEHQVGQRGRALRAFLAGDRLPHLEVGGGEDLDGRAAARVMSGDDAGDHLAQAAIRERLGDRGIGGVSRFPPPRGYSPQPVTRMTGKPGHRLLTRSMTSHPVSPGMPRSVSTRSNVPSAASRRARAS